MELHEIDVKTVPSLTLPWQEFRFMPVGDEQRGAQGFDRAKFRKHIRWGVDQNVYFGGMGDAIDLGSPSTRQKISAAGLYDVAEDALDYFAEKHLDEALEDMEPSRGRWIARVKGHHLWKFKSGKYKGYDTEDVLADYLGCPVTDELGAIISQVTLKTPDGKRSQKVQIYQWHGGGMASSLAGVLNKVKAIGDYWTTADVICVGHYPFKLGIPLDFPVPFFGKHSMLRDRRRIYCSTGGFCRGYQVGGRASYAEKGGMIGKNIGGVMVKIRPVHEEWGDRLDMNVEA